MPSRFDTLFDTVLNANTNPQPVKTATSDQAYRAAVARDEKTGSSITDPVTRDLIDLTDEQIMAKYGPEQGLGLVTARTRGMTRFDRDRTQGGSGGNFDTLSGVALGLGNTLGGMAALGVGAINDRAGSAIAQAVTAGSEWVRENQSDQLNVRRRAYEAGRQIENADSEEQYQRDLKDGTALAGLRRIGRDIGNSVSRMGSDGAILGDTVTEGVGSLLVGGPVAKGLAKVGNAVLKGARITTEAAMPAAIAAMEAGGAYQQTVSEIEGMSHDQLMASSPDYQELIADGWTPEAARTEVATSAGLTAAAITAPAAAVSGKLVSKFEASPLRAASLSSAAGNILRETVEEGAQSGAGQFAQNVGTKAFADANRSLTDGVGEQIGIGGIAGMGTAGVLQAPAIAGNATAEVVGRPAFAAADAAYRAGATVVDAAKTKISSIKEEARKASPVSTENVYAATEQTIADGEVAREAVNQEVEAGTLTPEQAQQVSERMAKLDETIRFKPEDLAGRGLSPEVEAQIGQATNRFDALSKAAEIAGSTERSPEQRVEAATFVNDMLSEHGAAMVGDMTSALEPLPEEHPITAQLRNYEDVLLSMQSNPEVQQALQVARNIASKVRAKDVDEAAIETPKGLQMAKSVVSLAQTNPELIDNDAAMTVLAHARNGKMSLPERVMKALAGVGVIKKAAATYEANAKAVKQKPVDIVSQEILDRDSGEATPYMSSAAHVRAIHQALAANDVGGAALQLRQMISFAQHMQNKAEALNKSLAEGSGRKENGFNYQVYTPAGKFRPSAEKMWVNPEVPNSVNLAQKVGLEAEAVGNMANEMALLYPELGVEPISLVPLDPILMAGTPQQVAVEARKRNAAAKTNPAPTAQPVTEPATVKPEAEAQPSTPVQAESQATETAAEQPTTPKVEIGVGPKRQNAPETEAEVEQAPAAEASLPLANSTTAAEPDTVAEPAPAAQETKKPEPDQQTDQAPEVTGSGVENASPEESGGPATDDTSDETGDVGPVGSLAEAYPALVGQDDGPVKNKFVEAFTPRKTARTRLAGVDSPIETIREATKSDAALTKFMGAESRRVLTPQIAEAFAQLWDVAEGVTSEMAAALDEFLSSPSDKKQGSPAFGEWLASGTGKDFEVNELPRGKALNILEVEVAPNGAKTFGYNQFLGEAAVLAGLNWMLSNNQTGRTFDKEDIAKSLGVDEDLVNDTDLFVFNSSHWHTGAVRTIAQKITEYWGVKANPDMPAGLTDGIPEAVAIQVLSAMERAGILTIETHNIQGKSPLFVGVNEMSEAIAKVKQFPALIDKALQIEVDEVYHVNEPPKKAPTHQMHGSPAKLSQQQQDAADAAQKTPYRVNPVMWTLVQQLGSEGIRNLFGKGDPLAPNLNKNHAASIKGYNQTLQSALEALSEMMAEMQAAADKKSEALEDQEMFFKYGFTSVGRMMMLGKANPQSSKLIREVLLPTWSTLDLSDRTGPHYQAYMLSMAQHVGDLFGIKVNKLKPEVAVAEIEALLHGEKLAPIIEAIDEWQTGLETSQEPISMDLVQDIRDAFGGEISVGALHALVDYARYQQAVALGETKAFKTAMYLEADGVTDGPVNSIVNFSSGEFTMEWLDLVNRGGLQLGKTPMSLADYIASDRGLSYSSKDDLYTMTTGEFALSLKHLWDELEGTAGAQVNQSLRRLLSEFLPDFSYDATKGELTMKRGLTKNPLTVTVYGSGVKGIGSKITSALLDEIYASLSNGRGMDPLLERDIRVLTSRVVTKTMRDYRVEDRSKETKFNTGVGTEYTLTPSMIANLRDNMSTLFARPMTDAIRGIMDSAIDTATTVRKATQVQSIHFKYAFLQAVSDALTSKDGREGANARDFLSRNELQAIFDKLIKQHPMINTGTQLVFVGGKAEAEGSTSDFAQDFSGKRHAPAHFWGPENAGVSGIPYLVIATGDGQMILNAMTGEEAPANTLPVYDGINMPLDEIRKDGEKINQAVFDGWMRNPVRSLADSFSAFLGSSGADVALESMPEAMREELEQAFGRRWNDAPFSPATIAMKTRILEEELKATANELDARKAVLKRTPMSIDHMASAGAPFVSEGSIDLPADPAEAIEVLNQEYAAELEKISKKPKVTRAVRNPDMETSIQTLGAVDQMSGARVIQHADLLAKLPQLKIPVAHREMIRASLASKASKGWKIVHGTDAEIRKYITQNGLTQPNNESDVHGYAIPADKVIYMWTADSETMAHELIHAATYDTVKAFYDDPTSVHPEVRAALKRTEALMEQFLSIDTSKIPADQLSDYEFAAEHIEAVRNAGATDADGKAMMLNEFMAWTLSNQNLMQIARAQKVSNPLARIAEAAWAALKKFFRLGLMPTVEDNVLSNLRFNTLVTMRAPAVSTLDVRERVGLAQAARPGWAADPRLFKIEMGFINRTQAIFDRTQQLRGKSGYNKIMSAHASMLKLADQIHDAFVTNGFKMDQQQSSMFKTMLISMGLDRDLDGNSLARGQVIYQKVLQELKVEDFMADPSSLDPGMRAVAEDKYNLIVGNVIVGQDRFKRSTLLPAFLALASVNDEFRAVLRKFDVPKSAKKDGSTLDDVLTNYAVQSMDKLTRTMSKEGLNAPNVQSAIDALMEHVSRTQEDRKSYFEQFATPAGNGIDRMNTWIVEQKDRLSQAGFDRLDALDQNSGNKAVKLAAKAGQAVMGIFNQDIGNEQSKFYVRLLDRTNVWSPVRELLSEVVGRTEDNAPVYDMIKSSRAFIQQVRQIFREKLPATIASKYSRPLSAAEWTTLHKGLLRTDLLALASLGNVRMREVLGDTSARAREISRLEKEVGKLDAAQAGLLLTKSRELADFMMTGKVPAILLRNARAVAGLHGELQGRAATNRGAPSDALVKAIDQLVSLYALDKVGADEQAVLSSLVQSEAAGLDFTMDYMKGQREDELGKNAAERGLLNHYKGRIGYEPKSGAHMVVAPDSEYQDLTTRGYVRVASYVGSAAEGAREKHGYYVAPLSGRSRFNQGVIQNIRETIYGVDPQTGFSFGMHNAGRIVDQRKVKALAARLHVNGLGRDGAALMPIFDGSGEIIAFERSIDPKQLERLDYETDLSKLLGMWRGRQVEEANAVQLNHELVGKLFDIWDKRDPSQDEEFVDILDEDVLKNDPVLADAVALFTPHTRDLIERAFGGRGFMVRKSMINDVTGYRAASIGDFWTGNTRIPENVAKGAAEAATAVFGKDAYKYLVTGEKLWQNFVSDARTTIVVRSVIVPVANMVSNVYQMVSRGVPIASITKGVPAKLAEIATYHANHQREIVLDAELRAAGNDTSKANAIKAELQSLRDSHRRLSIWPLIQAGEFSSVSEATVIGDESSLFEGKLVGYMEQLADKLPDSVRTAGRYAIISRDTALYQGLQRAVEYGDFIAKAIVFDDLVKRQNMSARDALVRISDEFINYDRLPGRTRGSLEANGLMWFWHFKLRALKIAMSTARNNPLHALLAAGIPAPDVIGSVGTPLTDNALAIAAEGKIHYSLGPLQGFHAHSLNPWFNLLT